MIETLPLEEMAKRIGTEVCLSDWVVVDQDRINQFADCTGDHMWLHVDPEKAAQGPYGKTIAHGFLTLSLVAHFKSQGGVVPEEMKMVLNYGLNKVRFLNPVIVDSRVRGRGILSDVQEKGNGRILVTTTFTVEIEGQEKPACVAESLTLFSV